MRRKTIIGSGPRARLLACLPLLAALFIAVLAGGCGERRIAREMPETAGTDRGAETALAVPARPPVAARPPRRAPAPIPDRALNIRTDCTSRDEHGYVEAIKLAVANGQVSQLDARIAVPKRGSCSFQLADFRQTRAAPHVELVARSGSKCATRMWHQQDRFTVAFSDCAEMCTPRSTADYIWTIELRLPDGACG